MAGAGPGLRLRSLRLPCSELRFLVGRPNGATAWGYGDRRSVELRTAPGASGAEKDLSVGARPGAVDVPALRPAPERPVHELRITSSPESARVVGGAWTFAEHRVQSLGTAIRLTHLTVLHPGYQPATFRLDRHEDVELRLELERVGGTPLRNRGCGAV